MKVQIVYQEGGWIFEALAYQWKKAFLVHSECEIVQGKTQPGADMYFHFYHGDAVLVKGALNVVYVTHISNYRHAVLIQSYAMRGALLITMSGETEKMVRTLVGNNHQVMSVLPESIHFKPVATKIAPLKIGYFSRRYEDKRKKDHLIQQIIDRVEDTENTECIIFGSGWGNDENLRKIHIDEGAFDLANYRQYLDEVNFVISLSLDEGAISILDAATCGVPVITTSVGYHSEIPLPLGSRIFAKPEQAQTYILELINEHERLSRIRFPSLESGVEQMLKRLTTFSPPRFRKAYLLRIFRIKYVHGFWVNVRWLFSMVKIKNLTKYFG